jgi:hypothetical protein
LLTRSYLLRETTYTCHLNRRQRHFLRYSECRGIPNSLGSMAEPLDRGEEPLLVFVSSQINDELMPWRRSARQTIIESGMTPWIFENTPASDQSAERTYLSAVANCDVFIWIFAGLTSEAIAEEVNLAQKLKKKLLVFRITSEGSPTDPDELFNLVRKNEKTRDVSFIGDFPKIIRASFLDLTARAVRGGASTKPPLMAAFDSLTNYSIGRCYARFCGVGLDDATALRLARDSTVGSHQTLIARSGLTVVSDQLGAGKSLAGERAHQAAILRGQDDGPIPVWLRAQEVIEGLSKAVLLLTQDFGEVETQGAHIVVDGVDEAEIDVAELLFQARVLTVAWPNTTIILTSRPSPAFNSQSENFLLPELSNEEAVRLITLAGGQIGGLYEFSTAVQEAVRRPLFALLLGRSLRDHSRNVTRQELVAHMIDHALKGAADSEVARDALRKLAITTTDRRGPIPLADVFDVTAISRTGLAEIDDRSVKFGLAIVEQWFAAEAVQLSLISVEEVAKDRRRLLRWRYALAIAVAISSNDEITSILCALVGAGSGLLAWIIDESIASGLGNAIAALPSSLEAGDQLRKSTLQVASALGPLAQYGTPIGTDGRLPALGIAVNGDEITISWWEGFRPLEEEVVELAGIEDGGWSTTRWSRNSGQSGWAWRYALGETQKTLKSTIAKRKLPVPPMLQNEWDWFMANSLLNRSATRSDPISTKDLKDLVANFDKIMSPTDRLGLGSTNFIVQLEVIHQLMTRLPDAVVMNSPWPGPNRAASSWVGGDYSPERLGERLIAVFTAAIAGYEWLATEIATPVSRFLPTHIKQPAVVRISLLREGSVASIGKPPLMSWWMESLPEGQTGFVDVTIGDDLQTHDKTGERWRQYQRIRPDTSDFTGLSTHTSVIDLFGDTPATDLMYGWLAEDLIELRWMRR